MSCSCTTHIDIVNIQRDRQIFENCMPPTGSSIKMNTYHFWVATTNSKTSQTNKKYRTFLVVCVMGICRVLERWWETRSGTASVLYCRVTHTYDVRCVLLRVVTNSSALKSPSLGVTHNFRYCIINLLFGRVVRDRFGCCYSCCCCCCGCFRSKMTCE